LESARNGVRSLGIDLNPLATFVATVKTRPYSRRDLSDFVRAYKESLDKFKKLDRAPRPDYPLLTKLFLPSSMDTLLRIRSLIESKRSRERTYNLLLLAWLSILEPASNAFKEGNGLKYRNKKRRPGKYQTLLDRIWIPRYFGPSVREFVINLWRTKCEQIAHDISQFPFEQMRPPIIKTGSCLEKDALAFAKDVDLAIFSPPYANRFDYFEAFKMELWMGGFVSQPADMQSLRHRSVRNNLAAARYKSTATWTPLAPFIDAMDPGASSVRMGIKNALQGYFEDMRRLLRELHRILTRRGKVAIVVGNSAYANSIIPTDALVARLAEEESYTLASISVARHLHVSSQQRITIRSLEAHMRESVVVLQRA
jgi:site-specific DNA-methyltransferase (adenine-specific)